MAIFSITLPIDSAPLGTGRFLVVIGILLAVGVLAAPCMMIAIVALAQAITEILI